MGQVDKTIYLSARTLQTKRPNTYAKDALFLGWAKTTQHLVELKEAEIAKNIRHWVKTLVPL